MNQTDLIELFIKDKIPPIGFGPGIIGYTTRKKKKTWVVFNNR